MTESNPILTAAEKEAETSTAVIALRKAYEDILRADNQDDDDDALSPALSREDSQMPETTAPTLAHLDFPPGSAGARINAGFMRITEVETLRRLCDDLFQSAMSAASSGMRAKFPPDLERVRWAQEAYLDYMNAADWTGADGKPWYRQDFDTRTGTYPALSDAEAA